jgi:hypothetical protein
MGVFIVSAQLKEHVSSTPGWPLPPLMPPEKPPRPAGPAPPPEMVLLPPQ